MEIEKLLIIPDRNNLEASIALAKEYGCGFEYNDFFMPKVLDDTGLLEEIETIYQKEIARGNYPEYCTSHGAFLDVTIFSDDARIREVSDLRVEQSLQIAREMGAKGVVFHTNYIPNFLTDFYRDNWVERNCIYFTEKAEKYSDLEIYIENMFDSDWELLARLGEALKAIPNVGICFDYAHAQVFGNEAELDQWVTAFAPYVKHIHINDNDFKSDLHLAVGDGQIDWKRFQEYYEKYFKNASVLIETNGYDKIKRSLEYLKAL